MSLKTLSCALVLLALCHAVVGIRTPIKNLDAQDRVHGSYIVRFCEDITEEQVQALVRKTGSPRVAHRYSRANGINLRDLSNDYLFELADDDVVCEISADLTIRASIAWGIDRIDQADLPLDDTYTPGLTGSGVDIWILDTGIQTTHAEFSNSGRTVQNMYDYYATNPASPDADNDGSGHGTHCSGSAGGQTVGVAPGANIYGIKVLSDSGSGSFSDLFDALEYVQSYYSGQSNPAAVVSMSLGAYCASGCGFESYFQDLVDANIVGVVAAGNDADDACDYIPAQYTDLITVGATESDDDFASYSNYGSCDDIHGPGTSVYSSYPTDSYAYLSGTSMATPHVAGVAALYLEDDSSLTPDTLLARMLDDAAVDKITGLPTSDTVNLLLQVPEGSSSTTPPGTVVGLVLNSRTMTSVDIKWMEPTTGGTPTSYTLRYRVSGSSPTTITGITTQLDSDYYHHEITGLSCGTRYRVLVRAVNDAGNGDWQSMNPRTASC